MISGNKPCLHIAFSFFIKASRSLAASGLIAGALLVTSMVGWSQIALVQAQPAGTGKGPVTGLPLPRFVSLKASRVNLRNGPGTKYPTAWVFRQAGLPVEVVAEFEAWRQVRDSEGTKGWVLRTLLSGRRTAQVVPWELSGKKERPRVPMTQRPAKSSAAVVLLEAGVVADVRNCDGTWCYVRVSQFSGYLPQNKLWGVYKNEHIR